jgi:mRNA-degrading endonuclease toxin of MazEF toxin-antitoxin module
VLHTDESSKDLPVVVVVPGTAKLKALRFPHTVRVEPSQENGLTMPTVFYGFQIQPVDKSIIRSPPMGKLSPQDLKRIEDAVREVLDLQTA